MEPNLDRRYCLCMENPCLKTAIFYYIFEYKGDFNLFIADLQDTRGFWILKSEMFYFSRSLGTDGDFWNSAGLEAFISQQWRIHPADVGGEHACIPFLILSSNRGNAHVSRIKRHLLFQKRRFQVLLYLLTIKQRCPWDKGLDSPRVAFHPGRCLQSWAGIPKKGNPGERFTSQVTFYFHKQRWGEGQAAIFLLFLEGVIT